MKPQTCLVLFLVCAVTINFSIVKCQDDDTGDAGTATDTGSDGTNSETNSDDDSNSGSEGEVSSDAGSESNTQEESSADSNSENSDSGGSDGSSTDDSSADSDGADSTGDSTSNSDGSSDESVTEASTEVSTEKAPGTILAYTMNAAGDGTGMSTQISFEVKEDDAMEMTCIIEVDPNSVAAQLYPAEFPEASTSNDDDSGGTDADSSTSEDNGSNESTDSGTDSNTSDGDESGDTTNTGTDSDASEGNGDDEATNAGLSNDASDDNTGGSESDSSDTDGTSGDDSSASDDVNTVSDTDASEGTSEIRSVVGCSATMPHLYVVEDCTCVSSPTSTACANANARLLGCCDKTGTQTHTFTDLKPSEVENACLIISKGPIPSVSSGRRIPRFIPAPATFTRLFASFNFNSVNFLSSGAKTVSTSSSALSINFPAVVASSSSSSSGGSYTPGFFDNLPYIMLEGVTASTLNIIIAILILFYVGSIFLPLLNIAPFLNQIAAPFSRMGDYVSERLDVLENKVRSSIRKYNRRYYNNVRRVDYDANNYYYYDDYNTDYYTK